MMNSNKGDGFRLTFQNVNLLYPDLGKPIRVTYIPRDGKGLLQDDFGEGLDCTITSMADIFGPEYYGLIESFARRYGYNGNRWGTFAITIRKIMQSVMNYIGGEYRFKKSKSAYLKNVGFKWDTCKNLSDRKIPYILSLLNDGRNYYMNHSIVVIGYAEYENGRFLVVYDNWFPTSCLVDFNKMSVFSSINWME